MEPAAQKVEGYRYRLVGDKVQVIKVEKGKTGMKIWMRFPDTSIIMIWDAPTPRADVRVGDLLTLYTEVLINAEPAPTSKQ